MDASGSFDSTKVSLQALLKDIQEGQLQLPDFQRGWVWDDDHVRSLLASISVSFPIGAVMVLQTGNPSVKFKPRVVEGVKLFEPPAPDRLILDGQQRLTSLYQAVMMEEPVATQDAKKHRVSLYYYVDLALALDPSADRDDAVFGVPADRKLRFRDQVLRDLSTTEAECKADALPIALVFDNARLFQWQMAYVKAGDSAEQRLQRWNKIYEAVIQPFQQYQVPLIVLGKETSKEAVCKVFEKVNTGGVPLTVFELLTATYAAENFNLREDWDRKHEVIREARVLHGVANTDFLQTIALLSTLQRRRETPGSAVGCKRRDILDLELLQYQRWSGAAITGYSRAAKFLYDEKIFQSSDVPYRTQLVPLAAIFADLGGRAENHGVLAQIRRWFWCGVLGELYGSAVESRFPKDLVQVLDWIQGGAEPETITEAHFQRERLRTLRSRQSAAYKGIHALLMRDGARDLRSGQSVDSQEYFEDEIDIHHIFPRAWTLKNDIDQGMADCIVNKTPLSRQSNQIIGGSAPSAYLAKLEVETKVEPNELDRILATHLIEPAAMRADDFLAFFAAREEQLIERIEAALGKAVAGGGLVADYKTDAAHGANLNSASAVFLVEGDRDVDYIALAAEKVGRPDLLSGIELVPCGGVNGVVEKAIALKASGGGPTVMILDRDPNGRAAKKSLIEKYGFSKLQVITYGDLMEGNPELVEAEDLFPQELMQAFTDELGETQVLAEKVMRPDLKGWHFGFNKHGKDVIADWLREHSQPSDLGRFVQLVELARTRLGMEVGVAPLAVPSLLESAAMTLATLASEDDIGGAADGIAIDESQAEGLAEAAPAGQGYDWSLIDTAVTALPRGYWTSYGDLADLGGTHARPVGVHMASAPLPNAYRVLDTNGRIRDGFRWNDPEDSREVMEVLSSDGLSFDDSGAAHPTRRLRRADLEELLGLSRGSAESPVDGRESPSADPESDSIEWGWDAYESLLRIPADKLDICRLLVSKLENSFAVRSLPVRTVFRKGYVAFRYTITEGGLFRNLVTIDFTSYRNVRLGVPLRQAPGELGWTNPYPTLVERWLPEWKSWGWSIASLNEVPDVEPVVALAADHVAADIEPWVAKRHGTKLGSAP